MSYGHYMKRKASQEENGKQKNKKAFLDFYKMTGFTPTRQKNFNKKRHFSVRKNLYSQLSVSKLDFKNRSVLEIGPGNGQNALYWASLGPKNGTLLDGTFTSLQDTRNIFKKNNFRKKYKFIFRDLLKYKFNKRFDVVICEGTIPFQNNPKMFFKKVMKLVNPQGLIIITCVDAVGVLADILRKFRGQWITVHEKTMRKKITVLKKEFQLDLRLLKGMTRQIEDWVVDQIIHPWVGKTFSIKQAIACAGSSFTIRGTSPRFVQDWRWHKKIPVSNPQFNQNALVSYHKNIFNFLDHNSWNLQCSAKDGGKLLRLCNSIFHEVVTGTPSKQKAQRISKKVAQICNILPPNAGSIKKALKEYSTEITKAKKARLLRFRQLWGRGQQYIAFDKTG